MITIHINNLSQNYVKQRFITILALYPYFATNSNKINLKHENNFTTPQWNYTILCTPLPTCTHPSNTTLLNTLPIIIYLLPLSLQKVHDCSIQQSASVYNITYNICGFNIYLLLHVTEVKFVNQYIVHLIIILVVTLYCFVVQWYSLQYYLHYLSLQ